jgi:hypothetical protein
MGRASGNADRYRFSLACLHLGARTHSLRRRRLAPGLRLSPDNAIRGLLRRSDLGDGRALSDRLRGTGLRGGGLPCGRDEESQPQRPARHARLGRDGGRLFHRPACRVARRPRSRGIRTGPGYDPRPHFRSPARERRQGCGDLVRFTARCSLWLAPRARSPNLPTTASSPDFCHFVTSRPTALGQPLR